MPNWSQMEESVWDWLAGYPAYTALGLEERRGYRGELVQFDLEAGEVPDPASMPLLAMKATELTFLGPEPNRQLEPIEGRATRYARLEGTLFYASKGTEYDRANTIEPAIDAFLLRINHRDARAYGFPTTGSGEGTRFRFQGGNIGEATLGDEEAFVWLWTWQFSLDLFGECFQTN